MNRTEAYDILAGILEQHRRLDFRTLCGMIGQTASVEMFARSGIRYVAEIIVVWSDARQKRLFIRGRIVDQNTFRFDTLKEKTYIDAPEDQRGSS